MSIDTCRICNIIDLGSPASVCVSRRQSPLQVHFEEKHKTLDLTKYEHIWKLSNFERSEMKKTWVKRGKVTTKRTKKSKIPPLVISESHRARIPAMYVVCCLLVIRKGFISNFFSIDDSETRPSTPPSHSPEVDEFSASETEAIEVDKAKASDLEEEDVEGSEIGDFLGGIDDLPVGTMVSVGREEVGENGERRDEFASGRNSVGFEVEPVPITNST